LDVSVHNPFSIKCFQGVLAGNAQECSLKSHVGKVTH
jgi:hypothetical protein